MKNGEDNEKYTSTIERRMKVKFFSLFWWETTKDHSIIILLLWEEEEEDDHYLFNKNIKLIENHSKVQLSSFLPSMVCNATNR